MAIKPTILVIDDDSVSLSLLSKLVKGLSYNVLEAKSGEQALKELNEHAVDLVVCDYEMPGMNGVELLKQVKLAYPRLPFILVTAYSNVEVIREAWDHGAFDFFQKPVFVDRLNQTIRLAIEYGHLSIARRKFPVHNENKPDPDLLDIGVIRELAVALKANDLMDVVNEFEVRSRTELEQMLRLHMDQEFGEVRKLAHRLAGTSLNLGLVKLAEMMREIEKQPEQPIPNGGQHLQESNEKSIYWLRQHLNQIFQDLAV